LAQALSGAVRQGQFTCQEAVAMARQADDPSLLSEALLALAESMVQSGDTAGALKTSLEAQPLFARSGKKDYEWVAWLIAALASRSAGDIQRAHEYGSNAQQLLSGLEQKLGKDNYDIYLNRPDVQFSRKQLSELIAGKT